MLWGRMMQGFISSSGLRLHNFEAHIHAWPIAGKKSNMHRQCDDQWSQGQTQKKELTLTSTIPQDFHENARICECHQTRHSLYQHQSFLQTLQTQPIGPQLFRALSATSTLRSTESSRCGSAKPQGFSLPFLRRYGVVYVANPPALPACLVEWGLMTDCLSVLCFCLFSLS